VFVSSEKMDDEAMRRFSSLNPQQVAELFEQANTIAVRLKLAALNDQDSEHAVETAVERSSNDTGNLPIDEPSVRAVGLIGSSTGDKLCELSVDQTVSLSADEQKCAQDTAEEAKENEAPGYQHDAASPAVVSGIVRSAAAGKALYRHDTLSAVSA
jgi:hypothetical protein